MAEPMCPRPAALRPSSHDALRRKALTAAASVVLAFSTASCGSDKPIKDTDLDVDIPESMTDSGGAGSTDSGSPSDDSGMPGDTGTTPPMEDTAAPGPPDCTEVAPEEWAECCQALEEWCIDEYGSDSEAYAECLYGPDYDGSTGCMAWGPPVPPRAMA